MGTVNNLKSLKKTSSFSHIYRNPAAFALFYICLLLTGCAGPLQFDYTPKGAPAFKASEQTTIFIGQFTDARREKFENPRTIGKISATVADLTGDKLTLSEDIAKVVTDAFVKEFSQAGYMVKTGEEGRNEAGFILSGEVKDFRLDIGPRDEISIGVSLKVIEKETGKTLWSGDEALKNSRYAGVMGNSRGTISNYISASLSDVIKKALTDSGTKIAGAGTFKPGESEKPVGTGRIIVSSEPSRAKVYINGVYFGLTPNTFDTAPGVYELIVRLKGYKDGREKISVRAGQVTELEVILEKE